VRAGNSTENRIQINPTFVDPHGAIDDAQVALHELGHTGGAEHDDPDTSDSFNFMHGCATCTNVSDKQLKTIIENAPEVKEDEK
jgi:hypothetical protein